MYTIRNLIFEFHLVLGEWNCLRNHLQNERVSTHLGLHYPLLTGPIVAQRDPARMTGFTAFRAMLTVRAVSM